MTGGWPVGHALGIKKIFEVVLKLNSITLSPKSARLVEQEQDATHLLDWVEAAAYATTETEIFKR